MDRDAAYARYEKAFEGIDAPFAFVDLDAFESNGRQMLEQAAGKPIRVATKSIRCGALIAHALELDDGFQGLLSFTLPETIALAENAFENLVLAYPTTDGKALAELGRLGGEKPDTAPVIMIDSAEHLDLIERHARGPVRVAIELDVGWWPAGGRVRIGPKRSPLRSAEDARALAEEITRRPSITLVGLMAYEGHVAGVGDDVAGGLRDTVRNLAIRAMQNASMSELAERRATVVAAVSEVAELEFVNGGGTGSLSRTVAEDAVTELAAGSGFYSPLLFDSYRSLDLTPAAMFALPVSRKPSPDVATALGGGYIASGPPGADRVPRPWLPAGLELDSLEMAGEVQTPLRGAPAKRLRVGDRVYFRHAKAGEMCERFNSLYLLRGDRIEDEVPTYRGEGHAFL